MLTKGKKSDIRSFIFIGALVKIYIFGGSKRGLWGASNITAVSNNV